MSEVLALIFMYTAWYHSINPTFDRLCTVSLHRENHISHLTGGRQGFCANLAGETGKHIDIGDDGLMNFGGVPYNEKED